MLLSSDERAPLKAVDFGLAAFFEPGGPPRTDLGLEVRGGAWAGGGMLAAWALSTAPRAQKAHAGGGGAPVTGP